LMHWLESRRGDPQTAMAFQLRELWSPILIGLACFAVSNLSFVHSSGPFVGSALTDIYNIRTLVDLAGVAMLYAYHVQRCELYMQRELDAIQNILQNQYVQYRQSRESIDVINHKYHDLKHQIAVLRAEPDADRRNAYLDGMEDEIRDYEAQNKTGNSVLDTVLTGKSLYCARHSVELTCVADGAQLGFMDVMDICTVFGNMLDNAIECELRIREKEKRLIHLMVYVKKGFLVIRCENYCPEPVEFRDGLPVSTKGDSVYHGYGIKSVQHTAGKYGGTATVHTKDGWFEITVMIPLQRA
ncbi:MAG: GHKL domain-containing protein, partial [Oscillospiraceae bacterium]|nr:GHKL domain-containing protein [Oscillospiraceae bacterium]